MRIAQDLADEDGEGNENQAEKLNPAFAFESRFEDEEGDEVYEDEEAWGDEEEEVEEIEIAPDDLAMYNKFFPVKEDPLLKTGVEKLRRKRRVRGRIWQI